MRSKYNKLTTCEAKKLQGQKEQSFLGAGRESKGDFTLKGYALVGYNWDKRSHVSTRPSYSIKQEEQGYNYMFCLF
jgi:hypothetical protein